MSYHDDEPADYPLKPCFECGEPDTVQREEDMCEACERTYCFKCDKVQRNLARIHHFRTTLDEPLPCNRCDDCCECFDFDEPQSLGDA